MESLGGNPKPSHHCWLNASNSKNEVMKLDGQAEGQGRIFQTNHSIDTAKWMDGGSVTCKVGQETEFEQFFSKEISILCEYYVILLANQTLKLKHYVLISLCNRNFITHAIVKCCYV